MAARVQQEAALRASIEGPTCQSEGIPRASHTAVQVQ